MRRKTLSRLLLFVVLSAFFMIVSGGCFDDKNSSNSSNLTTEDDNITPSYSVVFESNGGTYVPPQNILEEDLVSEPEIPEKSGYVFTGWLDEEGSMFDFTEPVYNSFTLTAKWEELQEITAQEISVMERARLEESASISFDGQPITAVEVVCSTSSRDIPALEISPVNDGPIMNTAGLIGLPVDIKFDNTAVKEASIVFRYDPSVLSIDPKNLAAAWYDESNDIMILLSEDSRVDTAKHTLSVSVDHFSVYAAVNSVEWNTIIQEQLPVIRTEDMHYNVILALDHSGSMEGRKMTQTISAAQNLVDILSDDDYITVLAFDDSISVIADMVKLTSAASGNRDSLKEQIGRIRANGGTDIQIALEKSMEYIREEGYTSFVILLSDGQSSVNDDVLQSLKEKNLRVIAVGVGGDADIPLMQRIADETGGSYLYAASAEEIEEKFDEITENDIGAKQDTDNDGIPDALETRGMKDQFLKVWKTDQNNADTDGDGFTDGQEMGKFVGSNIFDPQDWNHFERVSDPKTPTAYINLAQPKLPAKIYCTEFDFDNSTISFRFNVECTTYKHDGNREVFFSLPRNARVSLTHTPEGFTMKGTPSVKKLSTSAAKESKSLSGTIPATYCVRFTLEYSGTKSPSVQELSINFMADNMAQALSGTVPVEYRGATIKSTLINKTESALDKLKGQFFAKIIKALAQESEESIYSSLEDVKDEISVTPYFGVTALKVPDEVYEAFAKSILDAVKDSAVIKMTFDIDSFIKQPLKFVKALRESWGKPIFNSHTSTKTQVNVDGVTYTIETEGYSLAMAHVNMARVSRSSGSSRQEWLLTASSSPSNCLKVLAAYCKVLAGLTESLADQVTAVYVNEMLSAMGSTMTVNEGMIHNAGLLIKLLAGDTASGIPLLQEMLKYADKQIRSKLGVSESTANQVKTFIQESLTKKDKNTFTGAAKKLDIAGTLHDQFKDALKNYIGDPDADNLTKAETLYKKFKSAYDSLNGINIFEGFESSKEWPKFF